MSQSKDRVIIFDTTLRDGEQALRASLGLTEKLRIARTLERLKVDVMEVGFPVSSPGDFESVKTIADEIRDASVCGLARTLKRDIEACGEALKNAAAPRIHTFIATSPLHLEHKLKKSLAQAQEMAVDAIRLARNYTSDVEFSCEDAGRTPIDDLCRIVEAAIGAGATTINIPDTVGYTTPEEFAAIISALRVRVPNAHKAVFSVHCHNDLGLAVANSVAAVSAGARQIECTVNGIGERAGNCSLEEVAMILQTRSDQFGVSTRIDSKEIHRTSQLVSQICNMPIQPNKAIVGANAFAHSSGIHQDGVLKAQNTYEIISPETIGIKQNELNMTSRSGRHVIKHRLTELGYHTDDYDMESLYAKFLELADLKGQVYDYDLEALVFFDGLEHDEQSYQLKHLQVTSSSGTPATAMVQLAINGEERQEAATGIGPVDAVYKAIDRISGQPLDVIDYNLDAKGEGQNALGQVDIVVEHEGRRFHGAGLATDIVEASARAYLNALSVIDRARKISDHRRDEQYRQAI